MACELPCIVTNSGSIPYVIREQGIAKTVPQRDIVAIRSEANQLIDSSEQRRKMGENARNFVKREYSVKAISEQFHKMLQRE
jgi:glycosyltransferase involved in cell wall biosynthesis